MSIAEAITVVEFNVVCDIISKYLFCIRVLSYTVVLIVFGHGFLQEKAKIIRDV